MKKEQDIQQQIETTLNSVEDIQKVKASPFLKGKVLNRLFERKQEEGHLLLPWFTPKLQLATLIAIVIINTIVFVNMYSKADSETITKFAEAYELSTDLEFTVFE